MTTRTDPKASLVALKPKRKHTSHVTASELAYLNKLHPSQGCIWGEAWDNLDGTSLAMLGRGLARAGSEKSSLLSGLRSLG